MSQVVWHDVECGAYTADLPLWRELAAEADGPLLDVGAGTGRVTLDLAGRGHPVTALERDPELLGELSQRAAGLPVSTVGADARDFALEERFPLCLVPMQTIQLFGGSAGRLAFLRCARRHLQPGGVLAAAIVSELQSFELEPGTVEPLADARELDGVVFWSQPTAIRAEADGFVLERRRERIERDGARSVTHDRIRLDRLDPAGLEREGEQAGLRPAGRRRIDGDADYVGSDVVMLRA